MTATTSSILETVLNRRENANVNLNINRLIVMLVVMDTSDIQIVDLVNVI